MEELEVAKKAIALLLSNCAIIQGFLVRERKVVIGKVLIRRAGDHRFKSRVCHIDLFHAN